MSEHLYVSHQIEHLASGRPLIHGDVLDTDDLAPDDERIRAHLVPIEPRSTRRALPDKRSKQKSQRNEGC